MSVINTEAEVTNTQNLAASDTCAETQDERELTFSDIPNLDYKNLHQQSYELANQDGARTSMDLKDKPFPTKWSDDFATLVDCLVQPSKTLADQPCLGRRETPESKFTWITYKETCDQCKNVGAGITQLDKKYSANSEDLRVICIFGNNCPEWTISEYGCFMYGLVVVPLYNTLGEEATRFILNKTESKIVICDTAKRAQGLLKILPAQHLIKEIVVMQPEKEDTVLKELKNNSDINVNIHTLKEVMEMGSSNDLEMPKITQDQLALICYTSGTTGEPKGVMISHKNCVSSLGAFANIYKAINVKKIVHLSYLPLAHMFEQGVQSFTLAHGGQIGFYSGNIANLLSDVAELRPTIFCAVPRVLSKVYHGFMGQIADSKFKKNIYARAKISKLKDIENGKIGKNTIWDWIMFRHIQSKFGGRLKLVLSGGAALPPEVMNFARAAFGCVVIEGYGATETTAAITATYPNEHRPGVVGAPCLSAHFKLVDVPDMGITLEKDKRGEICVRGPTCTRGYFKDPEQTKKLIDAEGWLHTGDIGEWTEWGALKIVDRCKHIFKLSQGEYLAPEKLEMVYCLSTYIEQIFVDGNGEEAFPVAIVIPDVEQLKNHLPEELFYAEVETKTEENGTTVLEANGNSLNESTKQSKEATEKPVKSNKLTLQHDREEILSRICKSKEAKAIIMEELKHLAKKHDLKGFEMVCNVYLHNEPFTIENGLLTPTQKSCRGKLREKYKTNIDQLYKEAAKK